MADTTTSRTLARISALPRVVRVLAAAVAVGVAIWATAGMGGSRARESEHAGCFKGLRLLRHAVIAFERQHSFLPGSISLPDGSVEVLPEPGRSVLVMEQLTDPRDPHGFPSLDGPYRGLLRELPLNPFTGSREIVVAPPEQDAASFAAASRAGWAYLPDWGFDSHGPLPPGTILPCGSSDEPVDPTRGGVHAVQEIAFEIEDFQRWR